MQQDVNGNFEPLIKAQEEIHMEFERLEPAKQGFPSALGG